MKDYLNIPVSLAYIHKGKAIYLGKEGIVNFCSLIDYLDFAKAFVVKPIYGGGGKGILIIKMMLVSYNRTITTILRRDHGLLINKKRVRRIMRDMGIYAIYPKPNLSKRYHSQYIRPYLLRNLEINRPNQVWGVDVTYIRMKKGFMYLFIIIDWYSRYVVDYELSRTLDKSFVLSCLTRALSRQKPEIINSDQGGHFTNPDYIKLLEDNGVKISMDGKGQCLDNARTERFFRTLKYERIYISEYETPRELTNHAEPVYENLQHLSTSFFTGWCLPSRILSQKQAQ
jgi:transposase InsO family protein